MHSEAYDNVVFLQKLQLSLAQHTFTDGFCQLRMSKILLIPNIYTETILRPRYLVSCSVRIIFRSFKKLFKLLMIGIWDRKYGTRYRCRACFR